MANADIQDPSEDVETFFGTSQQNPEPSFFQSVNNQLSFADNERIKHLDEIFKLLELIEKTAEGSGKEEQGIKGAIEKVKNFFKDLKENINKIKEWMKKYKAAIIISGIGIAGIITAIILFL
ncbi:MAG: hypothetical protein WC376_04015 [Candidatus Nanoarchaeia archaeon]|jgi:hypothetical protein